MLSEQDLEIVIQRYTFDLESLAKLAKEYHIEYSVLRRLLVEKGIKIRNVTESLQKYVKFSNCIVCGRQFRMRDRWDSTTNHHKKTCGDPVCIHTLRSQSSKENWDDERKQYMSELFTGRDTTGWDILKKEQKSNWKGGCSSKSYRKIAFEELGLPMECMSCGETTVAVHHNDKNRSNNTKENLEIYCRSCHTTYHNRNGDNGWSILNKRYIPKISVDDLKKELSLGKSIRTICKDYGVCHHTIKNMTRKYEIGIPDKKIPITVEQIKKHLLEGKSVRWMNQEYNIASHVLIPDIIKENSIISPNRRYMKPKK